MTDPSSGAAMQVKFGAPGTAALVTSNWTCQQVVVVDSAQNVLGAPQFGVSPDGGATFSLWSGAVGLQCVRSTQHQAVYATGDIYWGQTAGAPPTGTAPLQLSTHRCLGQSASDPGRWFLLSTTQN